MNNVIRFERGFVELPYGTKLDVYLLPSGEIRYGMVGSSTTLGYAKGWLSQVHSRKGKTLKALKQQGYQGFTVEGIISRENKSGSSKPKTISEDDFYALMDYAAFIDNKPEAIALFKALRAMSLPDLAREALGISLLTWEEKKALFYKEYAKLIDWAKEDKEDWKQITEQFIFANS